MNVWLLSIKLFIRFKLLRRFDRFLTFTNENVETNLWHANPPGKRGKIDKELQRNNILFQR